MEQGYKRKLNSARNSSRVLSNTPEATPTSMAKIAKAGAREIKTTLTISSQLDPFLDWLFGIALSLAILKDILDFVGVGSLPAIGTAVTLFVSFCIGLIMFITGSRKMAKVARSTIKRFGVLASGTFIEMFFGINFLPIETLIVVIVFYMTLRERAQGAKNVSATINATLK